MLELHRVDQVRLEARDRFGKHGRGEPGLGGFGARVRRFRRPAGVRIAAELRGRQAKRRVVQPAVVRDLVGAPGGSDLPQPFRREAGRPLRMPRRVRLAEAEDVGGFDQRPARIAKDERRSPGVARRAHLRVAVPDDGGRAAQRLPRVAEQIRDVPARLRTAGSSRAEEPPDLPERAGRARRGAG